MIKRLHLYKFAMTIAVIIISILITACNVKESPFLIVQPTSEIDLPVRQLTAGHSFSLVLTNSGKVYSWGYNSDCAGERAPEDVHKPMLVKIDEKVDCIGGNETHCYAITESNNLYMWGSNTEGQLGDGSFESTLNPVKVNLPDTTIKKISLGLGHTLLLTEKGDVYSWGYNKYGQLGNGKTENANTPLKIEFDMAIVDIAAGDFHNLAITKSGELYTWGDNQRFELGLGDNTIQYSPQKVATELRFTSVEAGPSSSFAITKNGDAYSWGASNRGVLGQGDNFNIKKPTKIQSLENIKRIYTGWLFTFAVDDNKSYYAWGENEHAELGTITELKFVSTPIKIDLPEAVTKISCGGAHSYIIGVSGKAYGWGAVGANDNKLITFFSPEVIEFN